jgi:hypothetical protein
MPITNTRQKLLNWKSFSEINFLTVFDGYNNTDYFNTEYFETSKKYSFWTYNNTVTKSSFLFYFFTANIEGFLDILKIIRCGEICGDSVLATNCMSYKSFYKMQ